MAGHDQRKGRQDRLCRDSVKRGRSRRASLLGAATGAATPPAGGYCAEALEQRVLLVTTIPNIPAWVHAGPDGITGGNPAGISDRPVTGAVEAIVVDPSNPNLVYIGAANGGVWKTEKAYHATDGIDNDGDTRIDAADPEERPQWTAVTDHLPSLSISALALDLNDSTRQTLYVGTGQTSSFNLLGRGVGLYKTTNGGATWRVFREPFERLTIRKIVPTDIDLPGGAGKRILVAAEGEARTDYSYTHALTGGLFRSKSSGNGFEPVPTPGSDGIDNDGLNGVDDRGEGLTRGNYSDLVADPNNPLRFYAAKTDDASGGRVAVYVSNDGGNTWSDVRLPLPAHMPANSVTRVKLAVSDTPVAGQSPVYAGLVVRPFAEVISPAAATTNQLIVDDPGMFLPGDELVLIGETGVKVVSIDFDLKTLTLSKALATGHVRNELVRLNDTSNQRLLAVFRSVDGGANWQRMERPGDRDGGLHPGGQGGIHLGLAADPNNPNIVYVGGDRQLVANHGRLLRGDAGAAVGSQWQLISGSGANGTAPHADSRALVIDPLGNLLEGDDGGIYRLMNPGSSSRRWESVIDNLSVTEVAVAAYDPIGDRIVAAAQDNGVSVQPGPGLKRWEVKMGGDGIAATAGVVRNSPDTAADDQSILYFMSQRLTNLRTLRGNTLATPALEVTLPNGTKKPLSDLATVSFSTRLAANALAGERLLIGGFPFLYESLDGGATATLLNGAPMVASGDTFVPKPNYNIGLVTGMVYGGREPDPLVLGRTVPKPDVGWVGTTGSASGQFLYVRSGAAGTIFKPVKSWKKDSLGVTRGRVNDVAVNPNNWKHVFVLDSSGKVWFSPNGGEDPSDVSKWTWTDLSEGLPKTAEVPYQTLTVVEDFGVEVVLVGGPDGVYRRILTSPAGPWVRLGSGLPQVVVSDLTYDERDGLLVAATMGRGVWTLPAGPSLLAQPAVLRLEGSNGADEFELELDENDLNVLEVYQFTGATRPASPTHRFPLAALERIELIGLDGDDRFTLNTTRGAIQVPRGILLDGGANAGLGDRVVLRRTSSASVRKAKPPTRPNPEITVLDAWGRRGVQKIETAGVESVTPQRVVVAAIDAEAAGMRALADASEAFGDGLSSMTLAGLSGNSLGGSINGAPNTSPKPKDDPSFDVARLTDEDFVHVNNSSSLLRRILGEGLGAFALESIGDGGSVASPQALAEALDRLDAIPGNVTLDGDDNARLYHVRVENKTLGGIADLDLGADLLGGLGEVRLTGQLRYSIDVSLDLTFGVDVDGFFVRPNAEGSPEIVMRNLRVEGSAEGLGRFGFLAVELRDAELTVDPDTSIALKIRHPDTPGDDLRLADFDLDRPASWMSLQLLADAGDNATDDLVLNGTFAVSAVVPGLNGAIPLAESDISLNFPDLGVDNLASLLPNNAAAQALMEFADLAAPQVLAELAKARDSFDDLFKSQVLDRELPFAPGTRVSDVVDVARAFTDSILRPLEQDPGTGDGAFTTLQDMLAALADSIGLDLSDPNLVSYDQATGEVAVRIPIHYEFDPLTRTVELDSLGGPGLDVSPMDLELDAALDLDLTFGFNVKSNLPLPQTFFVRLNSLAADVTAQATGIAVAGQLGAMSFDLSGGAIVLDADAAITVTDPTPADGKLTPADLQQIAGNPAQFGRIVLNTEVLAAAATVNALLGDETLGVEVENGRFAFLFRNTFDTSAQTQTPSAYALEMRGDVGLLGLPATTTLTGTVAARVNTTGGAVNKPDIGGSGVDLVFAADEGNHSSFGVTGTLTVTDFVNLTATGEFTGGLDAGGPLLTVSTATVSFPALDDSLAFKATDVVLGRDGSFTLGSAAVTGNNLLDRFGLGGFLPFDVSGVSISALPGEALTLERFQVSVSGKFDKTVFQNELADPVISVGGLSPTAGGDFTFIINVRDGAVSFPSLSGPVTLGFESLNLGPMTAGASLTLGRFDAGVYVLDTVGATGSLRVNEDTSFSFTGLGRLTFPNGGARLELTSDPADPQSPFGLKLDADFDTGPGGLAQLHVEDFHAEFDLAIELDGALRRVDSRVEFLKGSVGSANVRFGSANDPLLLFQTADARLNLADDSQPLLTFGLMEATLPALTKFPGAAAFANMKGDVRNFAIGRQFEFIPLSDLDDPDGNFSVEFSGFPTAEDFGLPDWFPLSLTGVGLEFGPGALEGTDPNYILILSGGFESNANFPFDANVQGLGIDIGKLVDLFNPNIPAAQKDPLGVLARLDAFEVGVAPITIGETLKIGGKLGLRLIDHNGRKALVGTVNGFFEMAGFGGGAELTFAEVGPIVARLDVPLGIPLGPTGLLLEGVSGGFRFGGPEFGEQLPDEIDLTAPAGSIAKALLGDGTTFDPLAVSASQVDTEVRRLLDIRTNPANPEHDPNFFTWDLPFTLALRGTVTTVATPGILTGDLNLAARVDASGLAQGQAPQVQFLGSGDVKLYGIQLGAVGALLDFSDALNPTYNFAFAVPSPDNPLGFLFPARSVFEVAIDTDGLMEAPLLGLRTFLQQAASGTLDLLLDTIADRVREDRDDAKKVHADLVRQGRPRPLVELLSRTLSRLLLTGEAGPETLTIDAAFIRNKVLAALPLDLGQLNDEIVFTPQRVEETARLASALISELYATGAELFAGDSQQWLALADSFLQVLGGAASAALLAGWERFNPVFLAQGEIQPVVLGLPWGDPEQGSIIITKDGFTSQFNASITKIVRRVADSIFPLGGAMATLLSLGIEDELSVTLGVNGFDALFRSVMGGGNFPSLNPDLDFSAAFSGTLKFLGIDLGTVSGAALAPGSSALTFTPEAAAGNGTFQRVYLLPEGVSPDPGLIPIQTEEDFFKLRDLGGLIVTGQLFAPELLLDPVGLVQRGLDAPGGEFGLFTPPAGVQDFGPYIDRVVQHLLDDKELARMQFYVPSFGTLFDGENIQVQENPDGTNELILDTVGDIAQRIDAFMDAAYARGFLTASFLSLPLGRATLQATTQGVQFDATVPWLAGLEAGFTLGQRDVNVNQLVEDLARSLGVSALDLTNNGTSVPVRDRKDLDGDNDRDEILAHVPQLVVPFPIARGTGSLDVQRMAALFANTLGLPAGMFSPPLQADVSLSVYTPGFADPADPGASLVARKGGVEFDANLDVQNFVEGASAHFALPLSLGLVPDFQAQLAIDRLAVPGFGIVSDDLLRATFFAELTKEQDTLSMAIGRQPGPSGPGQPSELRILDLLTLTADGSLTIDAGAPGLFGELNLTAEGGGQGTLANDFYSLTATFEAQVNTTSSDPPGAIPAGPYVGVHAEGNLSVLGGALGLSGVFDLVADTQGLKAGGSGHLVVADADLNLDASFDLTVRRDGRVEATFAAPDLGLTASLDRFGCFRWAFFGVEPPLLSPIPFAFGACDQHVFVDDQRFNETDSPRTRNITVGLARPAEQELVVDFTLTSGTASGGDFTRVTGSPLTIPQGATSGTIQVTIAGDGDPEADETFSVSISNPRYTGFLPPAIAAIDARDASATVTILDDDQPPPPQPPGPVTVSVVAAPGLSLTGASENGLIVLSGIMPEKASGAISLRADGLLADDTVAVRYTIVATPRSLLTATHGADFIAGPSGASATGVLTLAGGRAVTINFSTLDDFAYELDEVFELRLEIERGSLLAPSTTLAADLVRIAIDNDDQDQPPGSLVFYDFDGFTPTHHYDASPHYVDPLLVATDFRHSSQLVATNSALNFNGLRDHVVTVTGPAAGFSLPTGPFTVDFWINPGDVTRRATLLAMGGGFEVFIENGSVRFTLRNTVGAEFTGTAGAIQTGRWQHVTLVYSGNAATAVSGGSSVIGYVNGVRRGSGSAGGAVRYGGQSLSIGATSLFQQPYSGRLDELRVWTAAFTDSQVAALPNQNTAGTEANLLIDYRFDEATGTTTTNSTGKGWQARLGTPIDIFGQFGRPDWVDASDSPVAKFARYLSPNRLKDAVPKIPPVDPAATQSFGPTNTGWAPRGAPIAQVPFYTFAVGRDTPTTSTGVFDFASMLALRIDGIDFFHRASADGPRRWELRSSKDNFTTVLATGATFPGGDFEHQRLIFDEPLRFIHPSQTAVFRLYGLDATASAGAWTIDNFALIAGTESPAVFNRPPVFPPLVINVPLGAATTINVLSGASDPDADPMTVTSFSGAAGTLSAIGNNLFTYTPPDGASSNIPLGFTIADRWGARMPVTIAAHPVGNAFDDAFTTAEDTTLTGSVLGNDKLPAGQSVIVSPSGALPASVTLNADGTFKFSPPPNSTAPVSFGYVVRGPDWSDTATVTITITPVNDVPAAVNRTFTVSEDTTLNVSAPGVLAGITDPDGDALKALLITGVTRGTLTLNTNGSFTYVPKSNDDTADSFTYVVTDGSGQSNTARVDIDILAVNDTPVGGSDSYTVDAGKTLTVAAPGVLANDSDIESPRSSLKTALFSGVSHGALTFKEDGSFVYTPAAGYSGPDGFQYRISDGGRLSSPVVVSITVLQPNQPPTPVNDTQPAVNESTTSTPTTVTFTIASILANDTDPEGSPLTVTSLGPPSLGTVSFSGALSSTTTTIRYTAPSANFNGTVTIPYTVADEKGATATASVILTINPTNDPPVAVNNSFALNLNFSPSLQVFSPGVLGNDSDPDGGTLTAQLVSSPTRGSLSFSSNGSFTYTPFDSTSATDSFVYRARDASGLLSNNASVTIQITGFTNTAANGYVSYARLGFDANNNHVWDFDDANGNGARDVGESGEPVADMNRAGRTGLFVSPSFDLDGDGVVSPAEGTLLVFNGTVSATLHPLLVPLTAPAGSPFITPYSTLIATLMAERGLTSAEAQHAVRETFGLSDADITVTDPIGYAAGGGAASAAYLVGHVQLADTYVQAASWLAASKGLPLSQVAGQFMSTLAARLAAGGPLDLSDAAQVSELLAAMAGRFALGVAGETISSVATVIAAGNALVAQQTPAPGPGPAALEFLNSVYRVEAAAQGPVLDELLGFAVGDVTAADLLAANTGVPLLALVSSARLGAVMPLPDTGPTLRNLSILPSSEGSPTRLAGTIEGLSPSSPVSLRINWDDGNVQDVVLPAGATSFSLDHIFADESPLHAAQDVRRVAVMLNVNGTPADIASVAALVRNVAPTVEAASLTPLVIVGGTARFSGAFSDPSPRDRFTAIINWGDGTTERRELPAGERRFDASHAYARRGRYMVTFTLLDSDGGGTTQSSAVRVVAPTPPALTRFQIDDGSKQRSMVRGFTAVFDQPVHVEAGQIVLRRQDGIEYGISAVNPSADGRTWRLGFFGPGTIGASLPDGNYTLRIPAAVVRNDLGQPLPRGFATAFHRLFGDLDGDGDVDRADGAHFKKAEGSREFSSRFDFAADFNSDGLINETDLAEFTSRLGRQLGGSVRPKGPALVPQQLFGPVLEGSRDDDAFIFGSTGARVLE